MPEVMLVFRYTIDICGEDIIDNTGNVEKCAEVDRILLVPEYAGYPG
jgi:hypothetical protein